MSETERIRILNVPLDTVDMEGAVCRFKDFFAAQKCSIVVTPNSEIVVNAGRNEELMHIIESADLIIPDGIGLVYASRILGFPLRERVTGIDFLEKALGLMAEEGKSVYLLGSRPGTEDNPSAAEIAAKKMIETFPGLKIGGTFHGYFNEEEEQTLIENINNSGADFLCVALGSPKQEKFMYKHRGKLKVKAAIGVGGSLDVWAGTVKRAPEFYCSHGLEWLYRFFQQPARYKRMAALPIFVLKVLLSKRRSGIRPLIGGRSNNGQS